jgi:uncharacterized protein (DUF427 family)
MALTVGTGPFGHKPGGVFNFELSRSQGIIYFEDSPRRIRAKFNGETVVDSCHAKLLHEHGHLPVYYFPEDDVRMDLLVPTDHHTYCPFKGEASHWSVRVGDRESENAAWSYPEPIEDAPFLTGYFAFYWNRMDEWYEEDELAFGHARDPYHRVDVVDTSRHVRVLVNGEPVADTRRARVLFETSLPPRWYIPPEDVRSDLLVESDNHTVCAYKGIASYWSVRLGDELEDDLIWFYPEPQHDADRVAGYLAFYNERVDIEIDGELQERPLTPFSRRKDAPKVAPT